MTEEKDRLLAAAISQIEKDHGKGAIMRLGSRDVLVPVSVIPSGCLSIDAALGVGGFPRGRVSSFSSPTTLPATSPSFRSFRTASLVNIPRRSRTAELSARTRSARKVRMHTGSNYPRTIVTRTSLTWASTAF